MVHKPNSIFEAAQAVLANEANVPPPRVSKEIRYKNKSGETRISSVSPAKEAEEVKLIKALGGTIIKISDVTH